MFHKLTYFALSIVLIVLPGSAPAFAQEIDFLPAGIFSSEYEYKSISTSSMLKTGMEKESILEKQLSRTKLDNDAVDGDIAYQKTLHLFHFQYGSQATVNWGLTVPYVVAGRESNIHIEDATDTAQIQFKENYKSAESQGLGDVSVNASWRPIYTDTVDFRLKLELTANTGAYHYNDPKNVSLGNGAPTTGVFMEFNFYSTSSDIIGEVDLMGLATLNSTITDPDGKSYELKRSAGAKLRLNLSSFSGAWGYGGGINLLGVGETLIDDESQNDSYLVMTYNLFLQFGNLYKLEKQTVKRPWVIGMTIENPLYGTNAPVDNIIGIKARLYF